MYEFLLLSILSASTFTLGKKVLLVTIPSFLTGFRLLCASALFLGFYFFVQRGPLASVKRLPWWLIFKISLTAFFGGYILEFWALQYMISAKAALLCSCAPVMAAVLSYFSFQEVMTTKKAIGLVLSVLGFFPELITSAQQEGQGIFFFSWPEMALFVAVAAFSYGWVLVRTALKKHHTPVALLNGMGMLVGGIMALAFSFIDPSRTSFASHSFALPVIDWPYFMYYGLSLVVIGNVACYILYGYLLKRYTATILTFGELLTPLFAAIFGWLFLHEYVHWTFFVSLSTILVGVYLYYTEERRLGYVQ